MRICMYVHQYFGSDACIGLYEMRRNSDWPGVALDGRMLSQRCIATIASNVSEVVAEGRPLEELR